MIATTMRCLSKRPLAAAAFAAVASEPTLGPHGPWPLASCVQAFSSPPRITRLARTQRCVTTSTTDARDTEAPKLPDSHRVFVGNLSPNTCKEELLRDSFGEFGPVVDVTLHGLWKRSVDDDDDEASQKKRSKVKPYAFVTFADASAAAGALSVRGEDADTMEGTAGLPPISGCVVKPAISRKPRPKSNKRKARAEERQELVQYLSKEANVVLQCPKSPLTRLVDYMQAFDNNVEMLSDLDPGRRAVTLLFIKAKDPADLADKLLSVPYAAIAVNKLYILDGDVINDGKIDEDVTQLSLKKLARLRKCTDENMVVRIQAFPPKIRSQLIASMDSKWDEDDLAGVDINPTGFTHTLSVVQIDTPKEYVSEDAKNNGGIVHLLGLTPALPTDAITTHDRSRFHENLNGEGGNKDESVSRAYYKLQEALTRYKGGGYSVANKLTGSVALDCGAAPGGWTKYLIDEIKCSKVFSVDPGTLDPAVEGLEGVEHMRSTIENAIPLLAEKGAAIDLWVSDMCLHSMSDQVDWLLKARNAGILSPTAMFVLTLKCNIGHSTSAYDKQVEKEVARLDGIASDIETLHLFSNRSGERTIIGSLTKRL